MIFRLILKTVFSYPFEPSLFLRHHYQDTLSLSYSHTGIYKFTSTGISWSTDFGRRPHSSHSPLSALKRYHYQSRTQHIYRYVWCSDAMTDSDRSTMEFFVRGTCNIRSTAPGYQRTYRMSNNGHRSGSLHVRPCITCKVSFI